jgi:hypothetical protein
MAYTTGTLSYLAGGPVEGSWKLWDYTTTDSLAAITASGYVTDATAKGMGVGDFVIVANQVNPQGYILQVQSMTAASGNTPGTATLVQPAGVGGSLLALPRNVIDGGDFTTNPWQRGTSFTSIANTLTYAADRWFAAGGASSSISVSQQAVTAVPSFGNALQFGRANTNANTAVITLGQVIESAYSVRAQGQQVTLSFWAQAGANWSPANGNLNVQIVSRYWQQPIGRERGGWIVDGLQLVDGHAAAGIGRSGRKRCPAHHQRVDALFVHVAGAGELHPACGAVQCDPGRHCRSCGLRPDHRRAARDRTAADAVRASGYPNGARNLSALFLADQRTGIRRRGRHRLGQRLEQ